ncbi:hypothetical protein L3X38_010775 [Prunus dulcis]|uniref:Uncharacterized protein n=1 Tax=Prunus dulcis TaxID=3755 RepID=A0AAD4WGG9_PRUDU|nr:hypothetical protein L3X38_010775 [Prunus dulcis]
MGDPLGSYSELTGFGFVGTPKLSELEAGAIPGWVTLLGSCSVSSQEQTCEGPVVGAKADNIMLGGVRPVCCATLNLEEAFWELTGFGFVGTPKLSEWRAGAIPGWVTPWEVAPNSEVKRVGGWSNPRMGDHPGKLLRELPETKPCWLVRNCQAPDRLYRSTILFALGLGPHGFVFGSSRNNFPGWSTLGSCSSHSAVWCECADEDVGSLKGGGLNSEVKRVGGWSNPRMGDPLGSCSVSSQEQTREGPVVGAKADNIMLGGVGPIRCATLNLDETFWELTGFGFVGTPKLSELEAGAIPGWVTPWEVAP